MSYHSWSDIPPELRQARYSGPPRGRRRWTGTRRSAAGTESANSGRAVTSRGDSFSERGEFNAWQARLSVQTITQLTYIREAYNTTATQAHSYDHSTFLNDVHQRTLDIPVVEQMPNAFSIEQFAGFFCGEKILETEIHAAESYNRQARVE